MRSPHYDVIIVGAGPGGAAAAFSLARAGVRVLMLDKSRFPRDKTCGDGLSPRALSVLEDMGALQEIQAHSRAIHSLVITSPGGIPLSATIPRQDGLPDYGLVTPRLVLDDVLRQRAQATGATLHDNVHVSQVESLAEGRLTVTGAQGRQQVRYSGRVAVLATGASFQILQRTGLLAGPPQHMVAARAYFDGIPPLPDRFHFHFDGVPLPGYGWVFPLSDHSANIGAGFYRGPGERRRLPGNASQAFSLFLKHPPVRKLLEGASQEGPLKGFPLLVGFTQMPTFAPGLLVIGEAAGLVNPLTGEGVDAALESGQLAAGHLQAMFAAGDLTHARLAGYDRLLRRRFLAQFRLCEQIRDSFLRRGVLDWIIRLGNLRPQFKMTLVRIALSMQEVPENAGLRWLFRSLWAGGAPG